jgi:hypothetical protein
MLLVEVLYDQGLGKVLLTNFTLHIARFLVKIQVCASVLDLVEALSTAFDRALKRPLFRMDP